MFRRTTSLLLTAVLLLIMLPTATFAAQTWEKPGNSDLNILNGGVMLDDGDDFYFVQDGIFVQSGGKIRALSADKGRNLNLFNGYIYYTLGSLIRRVPVSGGESETIFSADTVIKQMYVFAGTIQFLADGTVYELKNGNSNAANICNIQDISGFIPTEYGLLYLTGKALNYTLWVNGRALLSGFTSCYTDSGYLALSMDSRNYMIRLSRLFGTFNAKTDLQDFNIHGSIQLSSLLAPDEENTVLDDNNALDFSPNKLLQEAGLSSETEAGKAGLMTTDTSMPATVAAQTLSDGQKNIVKRARQLTEIQWTPLENIYQWGQAGLFKAETTYKGVPYGQPVNCNGYIGYGISIDDFSSAVLDNTSNFYNSYSTYNKTAPLYSTDCSGFVSYAWGIPTRKTTYSLTDVAEKVGDQSLYSLQVGDCLDRTISHVILITGITYDTDGNINGLEVSEETPAITKVTKYGAGQAKSLSSFQSYYLNGGFAIYRYSGRDTVTYTPNVAVPLDDEVFSGMKDMAPKSHTSSFVGGKSVKLTSDIPGAAIYYTLDGSLPTLSSTKYTEALQIYGTTKLNAIAVSGYYSSSFVLEYTVKVPPASTPTASVSGGSTSGSVISPGSKIILSSASAGASIYYTTDGTEPTLSSAIYSVPITILQNTTIKAMAVAPGTNGSQTATFSYTIGNVYTITSTANNGGSISPSGSNSVMETCSQTYSITPSTGYAISDVSVDGVSVGAVSSYAFQNVSSNHSITASFKSTATLPFTDLNENAWYIDAVKFAYSRSLFNGTASTIFSPDLTMTRGMFITVLGRFAGLPDTLTSDIGIVTGTSVNIRSGPSTDTSVAGVVNYKNTVVQVLSQSGGWYAVKYGSITGYIRGDLLKAYSGNFTDLATGNYYSPYAEWASLTGIASGTTFSAESNISREDMCKFLYNFAVIYGKTLPQTISRTPFSDEAAIGYGDREAVYALQQAGVINGMGNGIFSPSGTATRAQVAQIYMKFVNAVS